MNDNPLLKLPPDDEYKNSKIYPFGTEYKENSSSPIKGAEAPVAGYYKTPSGQKVFTKIMIAKQNPFTRIWSNPHLDAAREVLASEIGRMIDPTIFPETKILRRRLESKDLKKNFSQIVSAYVHGHSHTTHEKLASQVSPHSRNFLFDLYKHIDPQKAITDYLHTIITNPADYHAFNGIITAEPPHKFIGVDRAESFYPHESDVNWRVIPVLFQHWIMNPENADIPIKKPLLQKFTDLKEPILSKIIERLPMFYNREERAKIPKLILRRFRPLEKLEQMSFPTVKHLIGTDRLPYK